MKGGFVSKILRWLGRGVYPSFLPTPHTAGAETYLEDMWNHTSKKVALLHTGLAMLISLSPFFLLGKLKLFPYLSPKDKQRLQDKLLFSRIYLVRIIGYAVRSHALVAILRDPKAREALLTKSKVTNAKNSLA